MFTNRNRYRIPFTLISISIAFLITGKAAYGEESEEYKKAEAIMGRAASMDNVHYHGSAKFMYLTGDAMARKLSNLIKGNEPTIHAEAEAILNSN